MTFWDKAKYASFGILAGAILLPFAIAAQETIHVRFKEGDVISASVMNSIFQQLEDATNSITSDDLVGTWTITQVVPYNGQPGYGTCRLNNSCEITGTTDSPDGLSRYRTDTVTIVKNGSTYTYSQANFSSFTNAQSNTPSSGNVSVLAETAIFKNGSVFNYFYAKKKNSRQIVLQDIQSSSNSFNMIILNRRDTAPLPPNDLTASVSGRSVLLTWTDQSADEIGFKVQRKTSATGTWVDVSTTPANAISYTVGGLTPGTYWFRVLATNSNGDSTSSSEVQVTIAG